MHSFSKTIKLNTDNIYFQGHFPNFPVLPAVGFVKLSHQLIEDELGVKLTLLKAEGWRFRQPLKSNIEVLFEVQLLDSDKNAPNKKIFRVSWNLIVSEMRKITEGLLEFAE